MRNRLLGVVILSLFAGCGASSSVSDSRTDGPPGNGFDLLMDSAVAADLATSKDLIMADLAMAPPDLVVVPPDLAMSPPDLAVVPPDLAVVSSPDLAVVSSPDLAVVSGPDLAVVSGPDLAMVSSPDLAVVSSPDLAVVSGPDLAMPPPDLAMPPPDLAMPPPDLATRPNYVFVTSTTYKPGALGALGGLTYADNQCNTRAQAAGLPGTYVAWLSTTQVSAVSRLGNHRGWMRPDGLLVFDLPGEVANKMYYPPRLNETGQDVAPGLAVTGTKADGTKANNCNDYSSVSGTVSAGWPSAGVGLWTENSSPSNLCANTNFRLYCFEVDYNVAPGLPSATGRRAFMTKMDYPSACNFQAGLACPDALCASEASAASLPGTYKALLSLTTTAASSRFAMQVGALAWVRLDGVQVVAQASDLALGKLMAPINVDTNGVHWGSSPVFVWSGSATTNTPGADLNDTCSDWGTLSANYTARVGIGGESYLPFFGSTQSHCSFTGRFYCLQE